MSVSFPIGSVRDAFPALERTDDGRRRIYLDNPAGTQVPRRVADAVARCLIESNANLGGFFATTLAAQEVVDGAHAAMADFLGGDADDMGNAVDVDSAGAAYLTGLTFSTNFPTVGAIDATQNGKMDGYVAKLNPAGSALVEGDGAAVEMEVCGSVVLSLMVFTDRG